MPDRGRPDADKEEYRGSDSRRRGSRRSDYEHRAANGYSPNCRPGQYAQNGPHLLPMTVAVPVPPATYPNGLPYIQNVHTQDRTAEGYRRRIRDT